MDAQKLQDNRWRSTFDLYRAALDIDPDKRSAFLESIECDPGIRQEVLELLQGLDTPADEAGAPKLRLDSTARYQIISRLGKGGSGQVYSARDTELDRVVALKFLDPENLNGLSVTHLIREAKAASALNHPNIVTVHEVIQANSGLAIVMEFVEGFVLREVVGSPMPLTQLSKIGSQLARALAAAHDSNIIHRDLKPENIVLRPDGYIKLLDFGLARRLDMTDASLASLPVGTLRYMSPEQASGRTLTPASDIFSFGVVIHELATGRHPFPAESAFGTVDAILTKEPIIDGSQLLPESLTSLVQAMLEKDPSARPTAQAVAKRLEEIGATKRIVDSKKVRRWSGISKKAYAAGGVTALLVGVGILWFRGSKIPLSSPRVSVKQLTTQIPENRATAAVISADGRLLAFATTDGVFIRELNSSSTYSLVSPPGFSIDKLRWMKNGIQILAGGFSASTQEPAIWSISLLRDPPRLVRVGARDPEPSYEGKKIAYTNAARSEIWISSASGEDSRKLITAKDRDKFYSLLWTPDGAVLSFSRVAVHSAVAQWNGPWDSYVDGPSSPQSYDSVNSDTGALQTRVPNLSMSSAFGLPDGRVFYTTFNRQRSSSGFDAWEAITDRHTGQFLKRPRLTGIEPGWIGTLSATVDGRDLVFLRSAAAHQIYVGDYSPTKPHIGNLARLTLDESSNFPHSWTHDSEAVLFESNRGGNYGLYKQQISARTAETILSGENNYTLPMMAPGSQWLLLYQGFQRKSYPSRLMRVMIGGGAPEEVNIGVPLDEFACPVKGGTCVLRVTEENAFVFFELDPVRGRGRELARTKRTTSIFGDWAISPDGKKIALPIHDRDEARIRLVCLSESANCEREIVIRGFSNLNGVNWTADGRGLFAVFATPVGWQLTHVDLNAVPTPLLEATFALASPNGRKVALMIDSVATNAWRAQNF